MRINDAIRHLIPICLVFCTRRLLNPCLGTVKPIGHHFLILEYYFGYFTPKLSTPNFKSPPQTYAVRARFPTKPEFLPEIHALEPKLGNSLRVPLFLPH